MKKAGILILILISIFALSACSDSDVPDGMQLVWGNDSDGYYFYAPEEWNISNVGAIKSAYSLRVNSSSVSFAEVTADIPFPTTDEKSEYFFGSYFGDNLKEFSKAPNVTINGEKTVFGADGSAADKAIKYAFNYEYSKVNYGFMQILMQKGDRFFIFTYSAPLINKSENQTYYDFYAEKVQEVINNFKFVSVTAEENKNEYEKDEDGYILISDSKLSGFDIFVPESFVPDYTEAMVSATHKDGSNVNMTEATATGVVVSKYWENRKSSLAEIVSDIVEIEINKSISFGNANTAFAYEYTFNYNGEKYHVYQVLAVEGPFLMQKGYAFTYTAKEENYSSHLDEIKKIIEKVNFE